MQVDVDLSPEQFAAKVSRQQGRLYLKSDGTFRLTNTGRRKFLVNNTQVALLQPLPYLRFGALGVRDKPANILVPCGLFVRLGLINDA